MPGSELTTNSWDGENRLARVATTSGIVDTFVYNRDGRRVQKATPTGVSNYVWDGRNIICEAELVGAVVAVYTLDASLYGNLISENRGSADSFYLFDELASTRALTNSTGAITDTACYTAFGGSVGAPGSTQHDYWFGGQLGYYYDSGDRNFYVRARFYDLVDRAILKPRS